MPERTTDLVVIGGGLGGTAAALTAARLGQRVILVERSDWLGGQLTAQAVPPDEHQWIETPLTSPSYRELRARVRDHYRRNYPLTDEARAWETLNPGFGNVSRLCHEPRVAALVIQEMLSPLIASGALTVLSPFEAVAADRDGERIGAVRVRGLRTGTEITLCAPLIVDATELGELLELADIPYVIGAESGAEHGELHAPAVADPLDQQAVSWCCALEYRAGEEHTIDRPAGYAHWRDTVDPRWPGPQLSWDDVVPDLLTTRTRPLFAGAAADLEAAGTDDLWHYRRILARRNLEPGFPGGEITLVNWPQIDYWELPLLGVDDVTRERALQGARELTLSLVHWMQTEAPRPDGGHGYPGLRLRGDVTGTEDGLAKEVYIRESRRIKALFTITEQHIGREMRGAETGAAHFADSVGIGYYRIDLHPSTSGRTYVDIDCFPFQIPLGALLPQGTANLLAAGKNIGTTHITNGAYRLHPVEWSIGEAAGALSAYCARSRTTPEAVHGTPSLLDGFQRLLTDRLGLSLAWPEDIRAPRARHDSIPKEVTAHAS
ncbi:FAD-dependent oxidoreductase [Nonomuraea aurantiaca]|uniref:FAD-dependent oxidoreductase n=1 Tax=Nonomuraea aurantiaca TaxID=2878562 RepID=UPI001CD95B7C|nr:FAD-dependent oxidoreductase [Nonomuraea aurantiaca]MCA2221862.1 FAD-dependent oxidoreductase [Nonomuraea aurantiaca]